MHEYLLGRASFIEQLQVQNRIASPSDRQAAFHLSSLVPLIPAFNVLLPRLLRFKSMSGIDEDGGVIPRQILRHMAQKSLEWRS